MIKRNIKLFNNKRDVIYLIVIFLIAMLPGCGDGTMMVIGATAMARFGIPSRGAYESAA